MLRSSLFTRHTSKLVVVLLTAAAVASTARAQLPVEPPGEIDSEPTPPGDEEPGEQDSLFGGPLLQRSKFTGDWRGWRTCLQDHGITYVRVKAPIIEVLRIAGPDPMRNN